MSTFGIEIEFLLENFPIVKYTLPLNGWIEKIKQLARDNIFTIMPWNVVLDGVDCLTLKPIIEFKTRILTPNRMNLTRDFLYQVKWFAEKNNFSFPGQVGIHFHVSNEIIETRDPFALLATTTDVDENSLFALMSGKNRAWAQCMPTNIFHEFVKHIPLETEYLTPLKLKEYFGISREWRVCINSRHPTVEYRYLGTFVLMSESGVDEVMKWLDYFILHTEKMSRVNEFTINGRKFSKGPLDKIIKVS
jgi:hypothetical protein